MRHCLDVVLGLWLAGSSPDRNTNNSRLLYDHTYHAGNYADVVKHSVLIELLRFMQKKSSPMVYAETHSGAGAYRLRSNESQTLAEHEQGINRIYGGNALSSGVDGTLPTDELLRLMNAFSEDSTDGEQDLVYPGSPLVASSLCRDHDSLMFCEKELEPFAKLSKVLGDDDRVVLLQDNGYKALRRFDNLRSQQRALIFIDPPYQMGSDTEQIASLVGFLRTHWRSARVAIWHPVSDRTRTRADRLYRTVKSAIGGGERDLLAAELHDDSIPDVGTGMLLVHPPYGIDGALLELLPSLGKALGTAKSTPRVKVEYL